MATNHKYTVRLPNGETCGHVHRNLASAGKCYELILRRLSLIELKAVRFGDDYKLERVKND